jgi:hypothetical protein
VAASTFFASGAGAGALDVELVPLPGPQATIAPIPTTAANTLK